MDAKDVEKELDAAEKLFDTTWEKASRLLDNAKKRLAMFEERFADLKPGFVEAVAQFVAKPGGPVQLIKVTVNEGNVTIVGEMKSLTVNGRLVRFVGDAPAEKKTEEPKP